MWNDDVWKFGVILISFILICFCFVVKAEAVITDIAVIHHTASPDVSASTIDKWHKEKGWDGIGYHFVIRWDGTIEEGRSLNKNGAHALGRNQYVGIVLTGYDNFSIMQINSLKKLLLKLRVLEIQNHHQECPGPGLDLQKIADELHIKFIEVK